MDYKILRPPLTETYELPSRNELLTLKSGELVKVTFKVGDDEPERMWVIIEDCSDSEIWTGKLDNDARQSSTADVLPAGKLVKFHPLDVIAVE